MNKVTFKFYLNKGKQKGEKYPIYLRLIVNRQKAEISTGYSIKLKEWNEESRRAKKSDEINKGLLAIENRIYEIKNIFSKENRNFQVQDIKYALAKENEQVFLLSYFEEFIKRLEKANEVVKGTINIFRTTKNYLIDFISEKYKRPDIITDNLNYKFINDFDLFLLEKGLQRNTVNKYHKKLKSVLLRAINEGALRLNPYSNFKMKTVPSNRTFLTKEELDKISTNALAGNESLIRVRDIFLFSVYTGLRFTDAINLTMDKISITGKGNDYIISNQEKTGEPVYIPLLEQAVKIIEKYNTQERAITGKVLPKISNQKLNAYLKTIADLTGIKKELTHHVARHTCATTILLSNGATMEAVSKWLGHSSIKHTQIYAKMTNEYLRQQADKIKIKI